MEFRVLFLSSTPLALLVSSYLKTTQPFELCPLSSTTVSFSRQVPLRSVRASAHLSLRLSQPHSTLTSALPHLNSPNNPYSYYVCITTTVVECRLHWGCNTPLIRLSNAHCALISSLMNYYNSLSNTYYNNYYTL